VGFGGGQVDITNGKFVFSCTEAYRVKDGKIGAPVKGATLIGDGAAALKKIARSATTWRWTPAWAIAARPANGCRWAWASRRC
jgi:predicted Zn-dependent protease